MVEIDPQRRAEDGVVRIAPADPERAEPETAVESLAGEIEARTEEDERRLVELIGDAVARADVLFHEEPQIRQRVRRMIHIRDRLAPPELVGGGIERRLDAVIGALLPVVRAGSSRAGAIRVRGGELE